jgi:hypothetical protein
LESQSVATSFWTCPANLHGRSTPTAGSRHLNSDMLLHVLGPLACSCQLLLMPTAQQLPSDCVAHGATLWCWMQLHYAESMHWMGDGPKMGEVALAHCWKARRCLTILLSCSEGQFLHQWLCCMLSPLPLPINRDSAKTTLQLRSAAPDWRSCWLRWLLLAKQQLLPRCPTPHQQAKVSQPCLPTQVRTLVQLQCTMLRELLEGVALMQRSAANIPHVFAVGALPDCYQFSATEALER